MAYMGNPCGVDATGQEFALVEIGDLFNDSDELMIRDDVMLTSNLLNGGSIDIPSQEVEMQGAHREVKVEAAAAAAVAPTPTPRPLWIDFEKTDNSKSVYQDNAQSFQVRKDATLKLVLATDVDWKRVDKVLLWATYQNPSYKYPVEVKDEEQRNGGLESFSVFRQAPSAGNKVGIEWEKQPDGCIVAKAQNWMLLEGTDLFVSFRAVSSYPKKGLGWFFHSELLDHLGDVVAKGSVYVKSLKIIRTDLKRKRQPSSSSYDVMTPSPSSSSDNGGDELDELPSKSPKQLIELLTQKEQEINKITEELKKRFK